MIKLSIIIPYFNTENYTNQLLACLDRQMDPDVEVILVDDGSTDDSGLICDRWEKSDDRIKVIHQDNL